MMASYAIKLSPTGAKIPAFIVKIDWPILKKFSMKRRKIRGFNRLGQPSAKESLKNSPKLICKNLVESRTKSLAKLDLITLTFKLY